MKVKALLVSAALLSLSCTALAEETALDGEKLYNEKTCMACHGPRGDKPLLPMYPIIAGQNQAYIEQQMKDIKSGARSNGQSIAMKGVMHLVSDDEIKAIATYVARLGKDGNK